MDPIEHPTREAAEAAAAKTRRKSFLLVLIEGEWAEVDEYSEPQLASAEAWGTCNHDGTKMLGTDGMWHEVA